MDVDSRLPDVMYVELHYHPHQWSDGPSQETYKFQVIGKSWGARWLVHAVWANKPEPPSMNPRALRILKSLISAALSEFSNHIIRGREIPPWDNSLLAWKDD